MLVVGKPSCDNKLARKSAPRFDSTNTRVLSVPKIKKQKKLIHLKLEGSSVCRRQVVRFNKDT